MVVFLRLNSGYRVKITLLKFKMIRMKKILILIFCTIVSFSCRNNSSSSKIKGLEKRDYKDLCFDTLSTSVKDNFFNHSISKHVLVEPGYFVWGLSVVKWKDKYHAYYARWRRKDQFKAWMTDCEIAHAVSTTPEGPFEFVNVVLESRKSSGWDINNSHNPYSIVVNGKICLYYIANDVAHYGTTVNGKLKHPDSTWLASNRELLRNSQRIGVAIADDPYGPFIRSKRPIVVPDNIKFKNIAVNPSVVFRNNQYTMIMKGDDVTKDGWFRIQLVGKAPTPEGPFEFSSKPVYDKAQTEDACMWFDNVLNTYYMVCHVMGKSELALFNSENGFDWQPDERNIFMEKEFFLSNGTIWKPERVERPFVLTDETGKPIMIYVAVADKNVTGNIAIPIKTE